MKVVLFASPGRVAGPSIARLGSCGWISASSYRIGGNSENVVRELEKKFSTFGIPSDISSPEGAEELIAGLSGKFPHIERLALVNVASQYPKREDFSRWEKGSLDDPDWRYFSSNFSVMQNTTKAVLKKFSGTELDIINFGDERARRYFDERKVHPFAKQVIDFAIGDAKEEGMRFLRMSGAAGRDLNPYLLSKLLILYATRELALAHPGGRVRINALAPGIMEPSPNDTREEAEAYAQRATLLRRMGGVSSAAAKIVHLLEDNAYMTGEIIPIDGGMHLLWLESLG